LWDTAGQERFRSVTRSYYRGAAAALLVFDITSRQSFINLNRWLADARALGSPNLVAVIVGNKSDREEDREVEWAEASRWAAENDVHYVEVSSFTGENVESPFVLAARSVLLAIESGALDPDKPGTGPIVTMPSVLPINQNWSFTQVGGGEANADGEWIPVSQFPTSTHAELIKLKKIPDPFIGLHEWDVQWLGEAVWAFKTTFVVTEKELSEKNVDLVFEGLDTNAVIELNGHKLAETDNMFVSYRLPAKEHLKVGSNDLLLTFPSSYLIGKELEAAHGKGHLWNGDSSRLHVRTAQYRYGWDWGPVLLTTGPWKPVYLEAYNVRIDDLRISTKVDEYLAAVIDVTVALSSDVSAKASVVLKDASGKALKTSDIDISNGKGSTSFEAKAGELELWWPVGYGKQVLHAVDVQVADEGGRPLDSKTQMIGIRRLQVVQEPLEGEEGRSFLFEVNNVRIFCGGSNWIPADSFLTNISDDRYRAWLQLMVDGNQNMIRVWGGGIYEPDVFYDICDELGLLVWQDSMFGCGQYPAYDDYLKRVEVETEQNIKRLRHHPSLAIWAGNNEDYQVAESLKLELDYSDEDPKTDFRKTNFPARHIYERLLPSIINEHSDVFYHRGSPYSGYGKPTTDRTYGDLHQWNVWHGSQEPWHNWDKLAGRFVSEFGMQGYPDIKTVDYWVGDNKAERYPQSRTMNNHNKADGFERRLELYLMENFKHAFDIESYVYYTQIMQAETLASAYRLWRRNWRGKGKEYTSGALVWQINDCWPVTSWAIVDYFLRPKPAYFAIKRELRPFTVGMTRKEVITYSENHPNTRVNFTADFELEIWGTNSTLEDKIVTLDVKSYDLNAPKQDEVLVYSMPKRQVTLSANASTELFKGSLVEFGQPLRTKQSEVPKSLIVSARLLDSDGTVLGRPEPFKFVHFPTEKELGFRWTRQEDTITFSTARPIKGLVFSASDVGEDVKSSAAAPEVRWSDQAIDIVPGEEYSVTAEGLGKREFK
ncbi:hypothetical protein FRB90_003901, partial [Tulasnella sp. 427]